MESGAEIDPLERIRLLLEYKSTAKQVTYKKLLAAFESLAKESKRVIAELKKKSTQAMRMLRWNTRVSMTMSFRSSSPAILSYLCYTPTS